MTKQEEEKKKKKERKQKKKPKHEEKAKKKRAINRDLSSKSAPAETASTDPSPRAITKGQASMKGKDAFLLKLETGGSCQKLEASDRAIVVDKTKASDNSSVRHPFEVDESDHCETPLEAYQDILPLLDEITKKIGKSRQSVRIYDPYYCSGGTRRKLNALGFCSVYNRNEDFYKIIELQNIPEYDIMITNPPYSGDHMERLLAFCMSSSKPFLLLLPHFVYTKEYYNRLCAADNRMFFVVPKTRYAYHPPSWVSSRALTLKKTTAPFPSFWYCRHNNFSLAWLEAQYGPSGKYDPKRPVQFAARTADIPRDFKGEFDASKKRPGPKARKRAAKRRKMAFNTG